MVTSSSVCFAIVEPGVGCVWADCAGASLGLGEQATRGLCGGGRVVLD